MDSEDVTLDWGANEDDEVLTSTVPKDAATMSGAESLLALATASGKQENNGNSINEDKDSDAVSLGGGDDDMDELYAYQSRTHLGGMTAGEARSAPSAKKQHSQEVISDKPSLSERPQSPPPSLVSASVSPHRTSNSDTKNNASSSNAIILNDHTPNGKRQEGSVSRSKSRSASLSESARPASTLPPPGTHGLPPKPVGVAVTTPYVRPSHPSIMSASTMAPPRDRDRDQRRHASPKRGRRHYSPDSEPPLAPGWEVRTARDGSNDQYYYNPKTDQSTWDRKVAAGLVPLSPTPLYSRDSTGRRSPVYDNPRRGRSSRYEPSSGRAVSPRLSYNDRHYSPPRDGHPSGFPPSRSDRGDSQRHQRVPSPEILPPYPDSRRGNDRDITGYNHAQRARTHQDRASYEEGSSVRRGGEIAVERARSPSPGRERHGSIRSSNIQERDSTRITSKGLRSDLAAGPYEDRDSKDRTGPSPRYRTAVLSPADTQLSSSAQNRRTSPPQRDDRYIAPNRDTFRARNPSPQASGPRQPKRMRSPVSPPRHADHTSSQPPYEAKKARHDIAPRDEPPRISEPPTLVPSAKYMEREEDQRRELQKGHDVKRQKTTDDLDSTSARRSVSDGIGSRDVRENDRHPRRSLPQTDGSIASMGPRRRDPLPPRREMDSYRPEPPDIRLRTDTYPERPPRGPDGDRESSRLDLPTRPRAMDFAAAELDYDRRESRYGPRRQPPEGPPNNSGFGYRASNPSPLIEEDRYRQRNRNRQENRYAPSADGSRYDMPQSARAVPSAPSDPNTIPLRPRFGDFYRPDEYAQTRRGRVSPHDTRRTNNAREPRQRSANAEETRPASEQVQMHSTGANSNQPSDTRLEDAETADVRTNKEDNRLVTSDLHSRNTEASFSSSLLEGQKHIAQEASSVAVTRDVDAAMVDDTPRVDVSATPVNDALTGSMDVDSSPLTYPPSPPAHNNKRKKSGKHSDTSQLGPSNGDALPRPVHGLPPKPDVRPSPSLLHRLSNPASANSSKQGSASLRDRVAQEPPTPLKPHATSSTRPSLRDRLDSHPDMVERNGEEQQQRQGHGANNNWRNNRSRKGRG